MHPDTLAPLPALLTMTLTTTVKEQLVLLLQSEKKILLLKWFNMLNTHLLNGYQLPSESVRTS